MFSAVALVFSTPELIEIVLGHLPLPSLLQAQLISRPIHGVIRTSPTLQQLLFLRPSPPSAEWHLNPLLRRHFQPFFVISYNSSSGADGAMYQIMEWARNQTSRSAFLHKEANWRKMLIVQPPSTTLLVSRDTRLEPPENCDTEISDTVTDAAREKVANMVFEHGITMGKVYDIVHSFLMKQPGGVFSLAFDSRDDNVRMTLRLYTKVAFDPADSRLHNRGLYRSEGMEVEMNDLDWTIVKNDWLDDERKVDQMFQSWGKDLTEQKGGMTDQEWWGLKLSFLSERLYHEYPD